MSGGLYIIGNKSLNSGYGIKCISDFSKSSSTATSYEPITKMNEANQISIAPNPYELWHSRLGHISNTKLSHIPTIKIKNNDQQVCEVCPLAKQQRLIFQKSKITSKSVFELIHIDLWGPYLVHSISQTKYVLTIVDDFSRVTWAYVIHGKSRVYHTS